MVSSLTPFFSVIVPVYNRANFIAPLLKSILSQQYENFELVIINDGSTDNTESLVNEYKDHRLRYLKIDNSERGAARNAGAAIARGSYFNFFDSDDIMLDHHLKTAYEFVQKNDTALWFHMGFEICDKSDRVITRETGVDKYPEKKLMVTNYLGCDSVFVKREFFAENKFNEDRRMASSEDWQLWLRLISRSPLLVCPEVTLKMIHHDNRSLLTISTDRIIERDSLMLKSLLEDESFRKKFAKELSLFEADRYTFFALSLALDKRRVSAIRFLIKGLVTAPTVLSRKRFWASLKIALMPG